ncbi:MAG: leucine-rich repeat domain-containing protein, partial [Bacteroidales bacterium]|nr:leucine-rich repeat domain-containing protein [Bacteroidales bacterium]
MRIKIILLFVFCLFSFVKIFSQNGMTGPLYWNLENGTLTITGEGDMPHYSSPSYSPWYPYRTSIITVVLSNGITSIGNNAFYNCTNISSVNLADLSSLTHIGSYAFRLTKITTTT